MRSDMLSAIISPEELEVEAAQKERKRRELEASRPKPSDEEFLFVEDPAESAERCPLHVIEREIELNRLIASARVSIVVFGERPSVASSHHSLRWSSSRGAST